MKAIIYIFIVLCVCALVSVIMPMIHADDSQFIQTCGGDSETLILCHDEQIQNLNSLFPLIEGGGSLKLYYPSYLSVGNIVLIVFIIFALFLCFILILIKRRKKDEKNSNNS